MTSEGSRRLGRPPDSSSAETRGRILDVARGCFAEFGFEATTNKTIASAAGVTRIVFLGDSFTFGDGIERGKDRFTDLIESRLNADDASGGGAPADEGVQRGAVARVAVDEAGAQPGQVHCGRHCGAG